jgi:hypothetical protein
VLRLGAAHPGGALHRLTRFEVLVNLEEVLDLEPVELGNVVDVPDVLDAWIPGWNTEHLVIATGLIGHAEHSHRPAPDHHSGECGFTDQDECIEWVPVQA